VVKLFFKLLGFFLLIGIFQSCSLSKSIGENEQIVAKNKIKIENNINKIQKVELENYILQPQTPKAFGLFYSNLYIQKKLSEKKDNWFNRWIIRIFGDEPVIWDAKKTVDSEQNIKKYLNNIGYFNAEVSSKIDKKPLKVEVSYTAKPGLPYLIALHEYNIQDSNLSVIDLAKNSLIRIGEPFNSYTLNDERKRIEDLIKDNGFYEFNKEYVSYLVDTTLRNRELKITTIINAQAYDISDSSAIGFKRYIINDVYIYPDFEIDQKLSVPYDTLVLDLNKDKRARAVGKYHFLYKNKLRTNPRVIAQSVFIESDEYFSNRDLLESYRKLNRFPAYKYVNINYKKKEGKSALDTHIKLFRSKQQSFTIETDGTNSSGDLGIRLGFNYGNKNIFKGGELLNLRFTAALENRKYSGYEESSYPKFLLFNTLEYGFNLSIYSPSFIIPIRQSRFPKYFKPQTFINLGYNYQVRPSYERYISSFVYGYEWKQSRSIFHRLSVLDLNVIKVFPSEKFQAAIDSIENQRYKSQYEDHFIASVNYDFIYNTQEFGKHQSFNFFNVRIEAAGNLTNALHNLFNQPKTDGYYQVFGIRFAQYIRIETDYRHYLALPNKHGIVGRINLGFGLPYGNSIALPFEKGFYGGGANGMRAWAYRDLGPGNYNNTIGPGYDKMGDIKIEGNLEYRFPLYKHLKGAAFADIGNIWLLYSSETFPGGDFKWSTFYKQFAFDVGVGFRLDFDFFIFRIDGAVKAQDPSKTEGNRFILPQSQINDIFWSFGIGYPF
jgi:outer membrane protein assembly factor BamA